MDLFLTSLDGADFSSEYQHDVHRYWHEIRGGRDMPARKDFDPLKVPAALGNMLLVDVQTTPPQFLFRLIGTRITSQKGSDDTGKSAEAIPGYGEIIRRFHWLLEHKKPYYTRCDFPWSGDEPRQYTSLALPFSEDGQRVTMILCCAHIFNRNDLQELRLWGIS